MNTRRAVLLIAVSVGLLFQSGCSESKKRSTKTLDDTTQGTETTTVDNGTRVTANQTGGAKIHVENPVCDFGVTGPGKKVKCEWKFSNTGTEELVIERIGTTCQCTVPDLKKKNYAPGESGVVEATYLSSTYPGQVEKHLTIFSNDKSNPRCELTIKGRVELQVTVAPSERLELFLNQPNAGAKAITITSKDGKPFAIRSFTSSHNTVSATFDPAAEKTEFVITPTVDVNKLKANLSGSIQIGLTHPETNTISLTYLALPMYTINPPRFIIQDAEPGKHVDRELLVMNNYGGKVEIDTVTSMNGGMEVAQQESQGNSVRLTVRITAPPQEGKNRRYMSDRLTVKMKDGEEVSATCSGWYKLTTLR